MNIYGSLADDFYVNMNLNTEMKLPDTRETILDFFGRVQKSYPELRNFYTRDNGDFVLEEDKDKGHQRWVSLEPRRICSGNINPADPAEAIRQHELILNLVPYMLSVSTLDCEALDFMLGFDFNYRGNHDQLVAEALGTGHAVEPLLEIPGARILNFEPSVMLALDESCRTQARLMVETRTSAYHVRRGEFPEDQITVYFTVRKYGSLTQETSFEEAFASLTSLGQELMEQYVIGNVLQPLAQAIAAS